MPEYSSNIDELKGLLEKIRSLQSNPAQIFREAAQALLPELRHRVHTDGKDSAGNQIGTYSPGYMKVRTGSYKNAAAKKGQQKKSGSGAPRPKYNRTSDTKVVLSLTRQMENDLSIVPTESGYGIGYLNPFNYQKAIKCEKHYNKQILTQVTEGELKLITETVQVSLENFLTGDSITI